MGHLENDLDYGLQLHRENLTKVAQILDWLSAEVHDNAVRHGFYEDYKKLQRWVEGMAPDMPNDASPGSEREAYIQFVKMLDWLHSTMEQAAIARMHSELSEWLEAIRKNKRQADEHCPTFLSAEIEAADVIIRVLDMCGKRGYRIGEAVVAKMEFNASRPYKHGKNS